MKLIDFLSHFTELENITVKSRTISYFNDWTARDLIKYMETFKLIGNAYIREIKFYSIYTYITIR